MEQGRIAAARAFGDETIVSNPSFYPYGIYTIPEISFIGKTEEQLTEEDVPYEVGVAYYREIARGQIRGDTTGRLKLIFHRETHAMLGVHIIGEGASELLHIGQAVMALGGTLDYFVDTVFNYPTLAECYKVAAFNGLNRVASVEVCAVCRLRPAAGSAEERRQWQRLSASRCPSGWWQGWLWTIKLQGELRCFPEQHEDEYALVELPTEDARERSASEVKAAADASRGHYGVGVGASGADPQRRGGRGAEPAAAQGRAHSGCWTRGAATRGLTAPVTVSNDADAFAAGIAARHGKLEQQVRVWTLGMGIGYGRYPFTEGVWEGGHTVVTLDEKENYCGCGGRGHLEGIMGHRAMRLRFLDMEPEEVFEAAKAGRCALRGVQAAVAQGAGCGDGDHRFTCAGRGSFTCRATTCASST